MPNASAPNCNSIAQATLRTRVEPCNHAQVGGPPAPCSDLSSTILVAPSPREARTIAGSLSCARPPRTMSTTAVRRR
eukprot:15393009-Alexandrium_andersonii.AAC.1